MCYLCPRTTVTHVSLQNMEEGRRGGGIIVYKSDILNRKS